MKSIKKHLNFILFFKKKDQILLKMYFFLPITIKNVLNVPYIYDYCPNFNTIFNIIVFFPQNFII